MKKNGGGINRLKKKVVTYKKRTACVEDQIEKVIHRSWITKIKYYPDLNYILSSSVDSLIHIHDIKNLEYRDERTFNIH